MTCKEYIHLLTSGQLANASLGVKMDARLHRMICKYCRSFTKNDKHLDDILQRYKEYKLEQEGGES